ncbi:hypothetical protein PSHT_12813 [Puccinia striiformis]|uniref:Uncharacterized protein n=2 Tax=Puccinia striiformis TaxID=27350 RepID=A0A2S4UUI0_9BASI|nr:hypothetical protein PSHT_12813 [Puccinia striiformis]POW09211.1 hypothetical protein PSTT_06951 [Puccinia striiformis]
MSPTWAHHPLGHVGPSMELPDKLEFTSQELFGSKGSQLGMFLNQWRMILELPQKYLSCGNEIITVLKSKGAYCWREATA